MAPGTTKETILQRLVEKLRLPGVTNIRTQPIRNRIDMLSTGIRIQAGVKVFGNDLTTIEQKETKIELGGKTRSLPLLHSSR
jgi:copper/silver efflux system protein